MLRYKDTDSVFRWARTEMKKVGIFFFFFFFFFLIDQYVDAQN